MALHLSGILKGPKVVFGELIFISKPVFERRGGEKVGFARRIGFGWVCFPILAPKRSSNLQGEI